ncbi:MAG: 23S rRNA (adenine(2503)-C(2))-methyltransferase RlmN [Chloroflexota bacterium]
MPVKRINLKALSERDLLEFIVREGLPTFRMRQLVHWIYERYACSIEEITEFSRRLREDLSKSAYIGNITLLEKKMSADGTTKYLFGLEDGESIESVLIPDEDRLTLCISSQVGCAMACRFCLTGIIGLRRNLQPHEIIDQFISVSRETSPVRLTNVVLMGMGEPLANFDNVVEALWRMVNFAHISPRRITLSTAGIAPKIIELPQKAPPVNLAISLNATTDGARDLIMPINRTYPLAALISACREYPLAPRRRITFEYVLLKGVNDSPADAVRLSNLLRGIPAKVNLIPFNPYEGAEFERPDDSRVLAFQKILVDRHITAIIRKSKGRDVGAACGQLRARYSMNARQS